MSIGIAGIIIMLVLLLIVFAIIGGVYLKVRNSVRSFSSQVLGTSDIRKGLQDMEKEYAATPKSVAAMTSLYLPKIKRDFPEFQYDEMKVRAENALTSYLLAIDSMNSSLLREGGQELKDELVMRISMLRDAGEKETFKQIKLHRTEIADYKKRNGRCIVTFQTSLQSMHTRVDQQGNLKEGHRELYTQAKYNTDVIYIQDRNKVEQESDFSLGLNCPNCGAPVSGLGSKVCAYCGTPIVELNIYAWTFSNIEEVKNN